RASAQYELHAWTEARASIESAIQLDTKREFPLSEYVYGAILEALRDYDGARAHLNKYLELEPKAQNAATIRSHMDKMGQEDQIAVPLELVVSSAALPIEPVGDVWVPGGIKALSSAALLKETPTYANFFANYCGAIAKELTIGASQGI